MQSVIEAPSPHLPSSPDAPATLPRGPGPTVAAAAILSAYIAATACIVLAYYHGQRASTRFAWFWLGLATIVVLTTWLVSQRFGSPRVRLFAIALAGVFTYL